MGAASGRTPSRQHPQTDGADGDVWQQRRRAKQRSAAVALDRIVLQIDGCESRRLVSLLANSQSNHSSLGNRRFTFTRDLSVARLEAALAEPRGDVPTARGSDDGFRPIIVLRHPISRLAALFNRLAPVGPCDHSARLGNYTTPIEEFRRAYLGQPGHAIFAPTAAACLVAGESIEACTASASAAASTAASAAAAAGDTNAVNASLSAWMRPARKRLRTSWVLLADEPEPGMRALHAALIRGSKAPIGALPPRQIPIVAGGEGTAFSLDALEASRWQGENGAGAAESGVASVGVGGGGGGGGRCARGRRQLTREAIAADAALLAEVRRREAVDLALYAFARRLAAEKAEAEGAETAAAAGSAQAAVTAAETAREWADDFPERVRRLQAAQPPQHRLPLVFTHIPKCAGSTFRNQLLLEYARRYRRPDDVACVLYRDVHFREHAVSGAARPFNASAPGLARHGPECLDAAGYLRDTTLILTGHVAFHPLVLSRLRAPSLAAVVILREPFARLVSLFNMYPDGTFGTAPRNASAAERFAAAYRRRFAGRNALTCFTAGLSLCDSVGALTKAAVGAASLRRARFNLVERYDVVGLTEHSERSMAIVAWAFGWLPSLLRDGGLLGAKEASAACAESHPAASTGGSPSTICAASPASSGSWNARRRPTACCIASRPVSINSGYSTSQQTSSRLHQKARGSRRSCAPRILSTWRWHHRVQERETSPRRRWVLAGGWRALQMRISGCSRRIC